MELERLLSPIHLPRIELRNRIVMTAHGKWLSPSGAPAEAEVEYIRRRAAGGTGMIVTEVTPVHDTSQPHRGMARVLDPKNTEAFARLATAARVEGAAIFGQIYHCGSQATTSGYSDLPLWAPSAMRGFGSAEVAHEMSVVEIHEIIEAFGETAARFQAAGFSGVELHGSHGYLIQQFLSPVTNHRRDQYGGDATNRRRFVLEALEAVRGRVGTDYPIGMRICADERVAGGYGLREGIEVAKAIAETGEVDYLNVSNGTHESYERLVPPGLIPPGIGLEYAAGVKAHVSIPVIAVGAVHDPAMAEAALRDERADLIGMLRPLIADPDLPRKFAEGRGEDARPCIRINHCLKRVHDSAEIRCATNPKAGREWRLPETERASGQVLVVGGGPAGMEAAASSSERGYDVRLVEAADELGGWFLTASRFKPAAMPFLDHLRRRLDKAEVDIRLETRVSGLAELDFAADHVIIATGAQPTGAPFADRLQRRPADWHGPPLITDGFWNFAQQAGPGQHVMVTEGDAVDHVSATVTWALVRAGVRVTVVTPKAEFAASLDKPSRKVILDACMEHGGNVRILAGSTITAEARSRAVSVMRFSDRSVVNVDNVDAVVAAGNWRSTPLPAETTTATVQWIGDCVAPRGLAAAVWDGYRVARSLALR